MRGGVLQERNAELGAPGYFLMGNKPTCSLFWKTLVLSSKAVYTNIPDMIVENKGQSMPLLTRCAKLRHSLTVISQLVFLVDIFSGHTRCIDSHISNSKSE